MHGPVILHFNDFNSSPPAFAKSQFTNVWCVRSEFYRRTDYAGCDCAARGQHIDIIVGFSFSELLCGRMYKGWSRRGHMNRTQRYRYVGHLHCCQFTRPTVHITVDFKPQETAAGDLSHQIGLPEDNCLRSRRRFYMGGNRTMLCVVDIGRNVQSRPVYWRANTAGLVLLTATGLVIRTIDVDRVIDGRINEIIFNDGSSYADSAMSRPPLLRAPRCEFVVDTTR